MTIVETSKFSLFCKSGGEVNQQKILYLHGNPGSSEDLNAECFNNLAKDFHIVAIDRPGHGRSQTKEFGIEINKQAVEEITKQLQWSNFIIMAHSWSSALALDYAAEQPGKVSALFLINPWVYPRPEDSTNSTKSLKLLKLPGAFQLLRSKVDSQLKAHYEKCFAPKSLPSGFMDKRGLNKEQTLAMLSDKFQLLESFPTIVEKYKKVSARTIILAAKDDQISSFSEQAERLFQDLPNASLISEPQGGHAFPYLEVSPITHNIHLLKEEIRHAANQTF